MKMIQTLADSSPLPQRLLEARTLKGISQKGLGIQLGMEPGSASGRMNHYEKGRHTPDYPTFKANCGRARCACCLLFLRESRNGGACLSYCEAVRERSEGFIEPNKGRKRRAFYRLG